MSEEKKINVRKIADNIGKAAAAASDHVSKGAVAVADKTKEIVSKSQEAVLNAVDQNGNGEIDIEDIIVLVDDLALEPGRFRLREKGSSGGQKGLGNIIDLLGTNEIKRIRIGIGEPKYDIVDYVLSKPSLEEQEEIDKALDEALLALKYALKVDFNKASSLFNKKKK